MDNHINWLDIEHRLDNTHKSIDVTLNRWFNVTSIDVTLYRYGQCTNWCDIEPVQCHINWLTLNRYWFNATSQLMWHWTNWTMLQSIDIEPISVQCHKSIDVTLNRFNVTSIDWHWTDIGQCTSQLMWHWTEWTITSIDWVLYRFNCQLTCRHCPTSVQCYINWLTLNRLDNLQVNWCDIEPIGQCTSIDWHCTDIGQCYKSIGDIEPCWSHQLTCSIVQPILVYKSMMAHSIGQCYKSIDVTLNQCWTMSTSQLM